MKKIIFIIMLLSSLSIHSTIIDNIQKYPWEWQKIADCKNGNIVLDKQTLSSHGRIFINYQLVLRDKEIIQELLDNEAIFIEMLNTKNELIVNLKNVDTVPTFYGYSQDQIKERKYKITQLNYGIEIEAFITQCRNGEFSCPFLDRLASIYREDCRILENP